MMKADYIWMNGEMIAWNEAKVHVLSHTLHYGLGVFEGIRFYKTPNGPAVFRLREHMERMFNGAKATFMDVPYTIEEIEQAIIETIKINKIEEGYIRPLFMYGAKTLAVSPKGCPLICSIAVWPWGKLLGDEAVTIKISPFIRIHPKSTHADMKICGHYVNSIFATCEAQDAGFTEALLMDYKGNVAEGAGENLFIVKDGNLHTPPLGTILAGITRKSVMQIAADQGLEVIEKDLTIEDVKSADEVFFTGTAAEICPIRQIDDTIKEPAPGDITKRLQDVFEKVITGREEKYDEWLTYVE